jgi:hypothetical protein
MAVTFSGGGYAGVVITTTQPIPDVPPSVIGQSYGGGYYAGQISTAGNGVADYYLVVGPVASAQNPSLQWKTSRTSTPGTYSVIDGPTNTNNMNNTSHPAAYFCKGLAVGGYTDWYLPARNELEICYYNLKPTTNTNNTNYGVNLNAVPSRSSNYTSGTPAQTTATDFKNTGAEDFIADAYWSSTQHISLQPDAWCEYFLNGDQFGIRDSAYSVRAVRRVAI